MDVNRRTKPTSTGAINNNKVHLSTNIMGRMNIHSSGATNCLSYLIYALHLMSLFLKRLHSCVPLSHYSRTCLSRRGISDRISNAYNNTLQRQGQALKEGGGAYMTKSRFLEEMQNQRVQDVGAEYGEMPNKWQKFCLVLTRMYHRQSDIPQYVRSGTMNRMHDRMRIVFIAVAVACFYVFFFYIEHSTANKISKDRDDAVTNENSQ